MEQSAVLIVDDEQKVLSSLERELREEGFEIFFAESGSEALQILSCYPCKVIITDVKMPVMNGLELLAKVKELYPEMVRIILSGHADTKLILNAVNKEGIDRYLTKPWNIDDVKAVLHQGIELYDLRKEVVSLRAQLRNRQ